MSAWLVRATQSLKDKWGQWVTRVGMLLAGVELLGDLDISSLAGPLQVIFPKQGARIFAGAVMLLFFLSHARHRKAAKVVQELKSDQAGAPE